MDMAYDEHLVVGTGDGSQMDAAEALQLEHPDYILEREKWKKYNDLYSADDIYLYLQTHTRENGEMFNKRVSRGYYYNYVASVVDLYIAYLFRSPIERNVPASQTSLFGDFQTNCDRRGTSFFSFMPFCATYSQIDGHVGVLVDMPKQPDEPFRNEKDRLEAGYRPYLTPIRANQIKDWELDELGNFVWVKIEVKRPQGRGWNEQHDTTSKSFLIWSRYDWQEWKLVGDEAYLVDSGQHGLGEVPLVIMYNKRRPDHQWFGLSPVRDIADINIGILNWCSLGDEEIYERCLNVLAMEKSGDSATVNISQYNVLEYDEGTQPPQYLVPGSTPLELIGSWVERAKDEIYRLAKLGGSTGLMGVREATSGIAYAFEFNETNQSLAEKAENLEKAEKEIYRLVAKWQKADFEGDVHYPREFGVEDFLMEFQVLTEGRMNLSSSTAIKELEKKISAKLFARDPQELRDVIMKEIQGSDPKMVEPWPDNPMLVPPVPPGGSGTSKAGSKKPS